MPASRKNLIARPAAKAASVEATSEPATVVVSIPPGPALETAPADLAITRRTKAARLRKVKGASTITTSAADDVALVPNATPPMADTAPTESKHASKKRKEVPVEPPTEPRRQSKQARLIEMLKRREGATIAELAAATGWQNHSVRGVISGALKKQLGLNVSSEQVKERGRVYRIATRTTGKRC